MIVKQNKKEIQCAVVICILAMILLSGCGSFDLAGWTIPDDQEFIKLISELNTPPKIGAYMVENFTHKASYAPISPYELFLSKRGDCDAFAKFGIFMAHENNIKTYEIRIFYKGTINKHMVAVYVETKGLSVTDNRPYFNKDGNYFNTFREIVEWNYNYFQYGEWTKYKVLDYEGLMIEEGERWKNSSQLL